MCAKSCNITSKTTINLLFRAAYSSKKLFILLFPISIIWVCNCNYSPATAAAAGWRFLQTTTTDTMESVASAPVTKHRSIKIVEEDRMSCTCTKRVTD